MGNSHSAEDAPYLGLDVDRLGGAPRHAGAEVTGARHGSARTDPARARGDAPGALEGIRDGQGRTALPERTGGLLGTSSYWRVWQEARPFALRPDKVGSPLARKPYDLRATGITNWLRAGLPVAEVARRAGNSPEVIHRRCAGCIDNSEEENNKKIEKVMGWDGTAM